MPIEELLEKLTEMFAKEHFKDYAVEDCITFRGVINPEEKESVLSNYRKFHDKLKAGVIQTPQKLLIGKGTSVSNLKEAANRVRKAKASECSNFAAAAAGIILSAVENGELKDDYNITIAGISSNHNVVVIFPKEMAAPTCDSDYREHYDKIVIVDPWLYALGWGESPVFYVGAYPLYSSMLQESIAQYHYQSIHDQKHQQAMAGVTQTTQAVSTSPTQSRPSTPTNPEKEEQSTPESRTPSRGNSPQRTAQSVQTASNDRVNESLPATSRSSSDSQASTSPPSDPSPAQVPSENDLSDRSISPVLSSLNPEASGSRRSSSQDSPVRTGSNSPRNRTLYTRPARVDTSITPEDVRIDEPLNADPVDQKSSNMSFYFQLAAFSAMAVAGVALIVLAIVAPLVVVPALVAAGAVAGAAALGISIATGVVAGGTGVALLGGSGVGFFKATRSDNEQKPEDKASDDLDTVFR